jgi:hypothetical protein
VQRISNGLKKVDAYLGSAQYPLSDLTQPLENRLSGGARAMG